MSLDGLRAWIGEVERKLGMRTKVMLVLAAIAIGVAGTAIYLVIDYRDKAVSEADVQRLQSELESGAGAAAGPETAGLQAEIDALEAQVEELRNETGGGKGNRGGGKGNRGGGGANSGGGGAAGPGSPVIPELPDAQDLPGLP